MTIKDYNEAKKIFLHYNGSYFHMQREEYLDQYMKFNISKKEERKWLKEKVEKILSKISEIKNNIIVVVKDSGYFLFQS